MIQEEKKLPEELEEAAKQYQAEEDWRYESLPDPHRRGFIAGAKWQKKQFEKNRLAACDAQTKEEYERETELVDKIVVGEHRMPTFSDAINYGINWQKKQDDELLTIAYMDGVQKGREAERKELTKWKKTKPERGNSFGAGPWYGSGIGQHKGEHTVFIHGYEISVDELFDKLPKE